MHHRRQEQIVQLKIREKRLENERKKRLKEAAAALKKAALIRKVLAHGGPWARKVLVTHLRRRQKESKAKLGVLKEALKDEIRFQKIVLNNKGTLKLPGTVNELTRALQEHLPEEEDDPPYAPASPPPVDVPEVLNPQPALPCPDNELQPPPPKRRTNTADTVSDATDETGLSFSRQGQWVATFYDQMFYLGQVIEVFNPQSAMVQYLEQSKSKRLF